MVVILLNSCVHFSVSAYVFTAGVLQSSGEDLGYPSPQCFPFSLVAEYLELPLFLLCERVAIAHLLGGKKLNLKYIFVHKQKFKQKLACWGEIIALKHPPSTANDQAFIFAWMFGEEDHTKSIFGRKKS